MSYVQTHTKLYRQYGHHNIMLFTTKDGMAFVVADPNYPMPLPTASHHHLQLM